MNATWRPDESEFWHPSGKRLNGVSGISQNPPGNDLEGPYPAKGVDVASGAIYPPASREHWSARRSWARGTSGGSRVKQAMAIAASRRSRPAPECDASIGPAAHSGGTVDRSATHGDGDRARRLVPGGIRRDGCQCVRP